MFKNVLLPYDGLELTLPSVLYSLELSKILGSKLFFLHIITNDALKNTALATKKSEKEAKEYCINRIRGIFKKVSEEAKKKEFKDYSIKIEFEESIEKGINNFISKNKIELCILTPSPYANAEDVGDIARKISKVSAIPTIFIKIGNNNLSSPRILFAIDEKENSKELDYALHLAKSLKGKIIFYHTTWKKEDCESADLLDHCIGKVKKNISHAQTRAREEKIGSKTIIESESTIEAGILRCLVRENIDLLIMKSSTSIIGGKADLILHNSMYPLLLIP